MIDHDTALDLLVDCVLACAYDDEAAKHTTQHAINDLDNVDREQVIGVAIDLINLLATPDPRPGEPLPDQATVQRHAERTIRRDQKWLHDHYRGAHNQ